MLKLDVYNIDGNKTGSQINLPENIFGEEPNDHVVYLAVKQYLANQRQGTHKAKERNEVAGSGKKIKRQKGTGTARAGDIKNPLFRGGGRVFGPQPRDYVVRLNKKVKTLARKVVLSKKAADENILVVEDFTFETPKTGEYYNILKNLEVNNTKTLLVLPDHDEMLYLSCRNIPNAKITRVQDLNTYEIMNAGKVIFALGAIEQIKGAMV